MTDYAAAGAGLLLAAALCLGARPAQAAQQDFVLDNETGYTIEEVYVSAAKTDDWEEDVLGRDVLEDGDAVKISFPRRENACRFDLKVVYDDGDDAVWTNLNLCEISTVEIHYNKRTGETTATTD
jgi:hypothetical protein